MYQNKRRDPALFLFLFCGTSHNKPQVLITYPPLAFVGRMQPPTRTTRSTNNPGAVDVPKACRSSTEVAAEKAKKKETAMGKVKKRNEQAAQMARVEEQIKIAQKEAVWAHGQG